MSTESLSETVKHYSDSNLNIKNYSDSKHSNITVTDVFKNLVDVIPNDDYMPYYVSRFKQLGYTRFMELVNKARKSGNDPQRLFFWMLKNNELVR